MPNPEIPEEMPTVSAGGAPLPRTTVDLEEGEEWKQYANCIGVDPDLFLNRLDAVGTSQAKAVCRTCVVREECLDYALTSNEKSGIWGGMDKGERRRVKWGRVIERTLARIVA